MKRKLSILLWMMLFFTFFPFEYNLYSQFFLASIALGMLIWSIINLEIKFKSLITPYTLLMLLLLCWSFLSLFWVVDRVGWLISNSVLVVAVVQSMVLTYLFSDKQFKEQLKFILLIVIITHHLIGWFEWLTAQNYLSHGGFTIDPYRRFNDPMLFFGNINDFALFMLFAIIYVLCWQPDLKRDFKIRGSVYLCKIVLVLSGLLLIYFADSRGILFSAFYAILFFGIIHISHTKLRRMTVVLSAIICLVTIALSYTDIVDYLAQDGSFVIRYNLIRNGWRHLKVTYFMGVGAGNTDNYMANYNYYPTYGFVVMHNWWMGTLVSYGLPFFAVYILYHIRVYVASYHLAVKYRSPMGKFVTTWLLGFIIAGMIPNTLFHFIWFWMIHHLVFVWFENEVQ